MEPEAKEAVLTALRQAVDQPTLANARALESVLRQAGVSANVFGRFNQNSSIDAAAGSSWRQAQAVRARKEAHPSHSAEHHLLRSGGARP